MAPQLYDENGNPVNYEEVIRQVPAENVGSGPTGASFNVVEGSRSPQNASEAMLRPTTLKQLQGYQNGQVVQLPVFADGQPLVARMRRPSMLMLAKAGKIPNQLLTSATELFTGNATRAENMGSDTLAQMFDIVAIICEESLIEPTYQDIKDAGLELTDDQMMAIFNYTQTGVRALKNFR